MNPSRPRVFFKNLGRSMMSMSIVNDSCATPEVCPMEFCPIYMICASLPRIIRKIRTKNTHANKLAMGEIPFLTPLSQSSANEHFRLLDDSQVLEIVPRLQVLARSSPESQSILIEKLRG